MMMRKVLIIALLLVVKNAVYGQDPAFEPINQARIGEVLLPSPDAASLGKYGNIPMGYASGRANISVPLFELKTQNLSVPISINYSTSGFMVDEVGSRVGMSWSINMGGVITRTVYDAADELSNTPPTPALFHSGGADQSVLDFLNLTHQGQNDGTDMQPDIFTYNFGSYQGKFIIRDTSLVPLSYNNLKFRTSLIEAFFIDGCDFKITTPDGISYYFGGAGATEYSATESYGTNCGTYKDFNMNPTAWYLKKITHPQGDSILFTYSPVNLNYKYSIEETQTRLKRNSVFVPGNCTGSSSPEPLPDKDAICVIRMMHNAVRLDNIVTSTGQSIKVNYRTRGDLIGDYLIQDVTLNKYNSTTRLKYFQFEYNEVTSTTYSNQWNQNDSTLKKRYFLKSVIEKNETGSRQNTSYYFHYHKLAELPPRLSFARDYWGYFNGKPNNNLLYLTRPSINNLDNLHTLFSASANREPDSSFSSKGLLAKIVYPTGGSDSIFYQGNAYKATEDQQGNVQNFTASVNGISYDMGSATIVESTAFSSNQNQNVVLTAQCTYFGQNGDYEPGYSRVVYSVFNVTDNQYIQPETSLNAGEGVVNSTTKSIQLVANKSYKIILKIYGIDVSANASIPFQNYETVSVTINKPIGGVRVFKIISKDPFSASHSVKKYFYSYLNDMGYSSSKNLTYNFDNFSSYKLYIPCDDCVALEAIYYTLTSSPIRNVSPFSGSNISYPSVIESFGENFENGGIEYLFTSQHDDLPPAKYGETIINTPYSNRTDWASGLNIYKREFQMSGSTLVTRKEVFTNFRVDNRVLNNFKGYTIKKSYDPPCEYYHNILNSPALFEVREYEVRQRWVYPDTITTKIYPITGTGILAQTVLNEHQNIASVLPSKVSTTNSEGNSIMIKTIYAYDLFTGNQPAWLTNLRTKGYQNAPVEQTERIVKNGIEYITSGLLMIYDNNAIQPYRTYRLEINGPIPSSSFSSCSVSNGVFNFDSRYKLESEFVFATNGTILQKSQPGSGDVKSYVWDYHFANVVAEVSNGVHNDIAYTSFEAAGKGNWTFAGMPASDNTSPTGLKSYNVQTGTLSKTVSASKTYTLTYWTKNTVPYAIAGTLTGYPIKGATLNGWTCYEHRISGVNSILITGTGYIDEVRLHPVDAGMKTMTYDPMIGVTSQVDEKNLIVYYAYDEFGRLKSIKDHMGNILKEVNYNYQSPITQ